jgi:nucleoside-diphosphate-sugar epimerase
MMRVLVAGATGVIGRELMPALVEAGHTAIGLTRSVPSAELIQSDTEVIFADALDRRAVTAAVEQAAPDAVVNMLTAIPAAINPKRLAEDFTVTNRLRTEGTANLLDAAARVGVTKVISQGLAYGYEPGRPGLATEDSSLWVEPPRPFLPVLNALRELERRTVEAQGTVLRFGHLYGPGTSYSAAGSFTQQVRAGKVPLVSGGTATFSFTHTADAAAAVVAALNSDHVGPLNIVDDEPAQMNEWLPYLADLVDAPSPKSAPAFLARFAVGPWGVAFMTKLRGADNSRAKSVLDWKLVHSSWRTGFATEFNDATAADAAGS